MGERMRNLLKVVLISLLIVLSTVFVTACDIVIVDITLDANGGNFSDGNSTSVIKTDGLSALKIPNNPEKEGYSFDGWFLDKDVWEQPFTANSFLDAPIQSDMRVYAKWIVKEEELDEPVKYTITFNTTGGTEIADIAIESGKTITIPDNPTKTGYAFAGWYLDEDYNTSAINILAQEISSNIMIYAKWDVDEEHVAPVTYTISFNTNGGSEIADIAIESGNTITFPDNPSKDGYTFDGWFWDKDIWEQPFTANSLLDASIHSNVTVYAKWIALYTSPKALLYKYNLDIDAYEVSAGTIMSGEVVIDSQYDDGINGNRAVKVIAKNAFKNKHITNIIIPNTIERIDSYAFQGCQELTSIIIPSSVTNIGKGILGGCNGLIELHAPFKEEYNIDNNSYLSYFFGGTSYVYNHLIPSTLTTIYINEGSIGIANNAFRGTSIVSVNIPSTVTTIGEMAFNRCNNMKTINLPNSITSIGVWAFAECSNLESIIIPNNVQNIGHYAFYNCINLTSITLPDNLITISDSLLEGCESLISITIPNNVTKIENYVFKGCSNLENIIIPDSVTNIGIAAFENCISLNDIVLPNSILSIGQRAFYACYNLNNIALSTNMQSIQKHTFKDCVSLKSITIPSSIVFIDNDVFLGCNSLENIIVDENNSGYKSIDGVVFTKDEIILLQYPIGNIRANYTIPTNVLSINNRAFYGAKNLVNIDIHDSIIAIGENAFGETTWYNNQSEGLVYAGKVAYNYKGEMPENTELIIIEGTKAIAVSAFKNLVNLTNIVIPASVRSIHSEAFYGCDGLTNITLSKNIIGIGHAAFSRARNMESIIVDEDNPYYKDIDGVLFNKAGTELIHYPIGNSRTSYNIPNSVTRIGSQSFYGCSNLTSIIISNEVEYIGQMAFRDCSSLMSIIIPNSVINIENAAFYECSNLISVIIFRTISEGITTNNYALGITHPDLVIYVPNDSVNAYKAAYGWSEHADKIEAIISNSSNGLHYAYSSDTDSYSVSQGSATDIDIVIPSYHDDGANGLKPVTIISDNAFYDNIIMESITIPSSVTRIEGSAFYGCSNLISITIPSNVISIGHNAFIACLGLTSITFEDNSQLISIGMSAFSSCISLISITIPTSVTSIGSSVFSFCSKLQIIEVSEENSYYKSIEGVLFDKAGTTLIEYPLGSTRTSYIIPDVVTNILSHVFYNSKNLTSIIIPEGVTSIESNLFYSCSKLDSIIIPSSVTSIKDHAFYGCTSITSINIPDSVISIGDGAFQECHHLESIIIPYSVASIGNMAFSRCYSLKQIEVAEANANYKSIDGVLFNKSGTELIQYPVGNSRTHYVILESVINIGIHAFSGCRSLTSITIPSMVTNIRDSTFYDCIYLTIINIDDNSELTIIGDWAFMDCKSLISITIPNNITSMGSNAFQGSSSLTSVVLKSETPPTIGTEIFDSTHNDLAIYVPSDSLEAYKTAECWSEYADKIFAIEE